ncbi:MAG: glycerate kinase [Abitibacteriaceae bacterium]|nr:glycerate kinase [Abditibacteriaceae bacterium]
MLHIILAPDSFKGSLSATQACAALERGARGALNGIECQFTAVPLADGGEGTVDALLRGAGGTSQTVRVRGPLRDEVEAQWGLLAGGQAVVEMAQASGLTLVPPEHRSAGQASSYGTGQVIQAALEAGCRELLIGIGGSATTDGGAGALQALGVRFLDANGRELPPGGTALNQLHRIDLTHLDPRLKDTKITVLCDVTNPLCGPDGAAFIYGPQKGASPREVEALDAALSHFADVVEATFGKDFRDIPGAGAAGGMGFGLMAFLGAHLTPGINAVLEATRFAAKLETADLVLTGEGSIDAQTLSGKALAGVADAARQVKDGAGVPIIAFGGAVRLTGTQLQDLGIMAALPLPDAPLSLQECVSRADELLSSAAERALRLWIADF